MLYLQNMLNENHINSALDFLFSELEFASEPAGLYDPMRYALAQGGKRLRPRLCLVAYALFADGPWGEEILQPAAALEIFHNFTLVHDDIMDNSPLRRGRETVWKKWDAPTAILSGDVMLIDSYTRIGKAPSDRLDAVMSLFSRTAAEVCEGQQYDMQFETQDNVAMEDYIKMIGLKTASLLACSAKMGAIIGGAAPLQCAALYDYGYKLGLAFQIEDDYLDSFGEEAVFGKPIGGDILNKKKTWLLLRSIEKGGAPALDSAFEISSDEEKIEKVKNIYRELGVDSEARQQIRDFTAEALSAVENIGLGAVKLEYLHRFAQKLVGRVR